MTREPASRAKAHTSYYLADGTKVPSVTTILRVIAKGEYLMTWANNLGLEGIDVNEYRKAQAGVGTLAHEMIASELTGREVAFYGFSQEERDRAENALRSFKAWRRTVDLEPLLVEQPLVSEAARYGGTIDLYARLNGRPGIIDVKTSNDIYDEHWYQVAGYRRMLEENGYPVEFNAIGRFGRDDSDGYDFKTSPSPEADLVVFDAAHALYLAEQARKAAIKNDVPMVRRRRGPSSVTLVLGGGGADGKEAPSVLPPATTNEEGR